MKKLFFTLLAIWMLMLCGCSALSRLMPQQALPEQAPTLEEQIEQKRAQLGSLQAELELVQAELDELEKQAAAIQKEEAEKARLAAEAEKEKAAQQAEQEAPPVKEEETPAQPAPEEPAASEEPDEPQETGADSFRFGSLDEIPAGPRSEAGERTLNLADQTIRVCQTEQTGTACTLYSRRYEADDGSIFETQRAENSVTGSFSFPLVEVASYRARIYWFDFANRVWYADDLMRGTYTASLIFISFDDGSQLLVSTPKLYKPLENEVMEYQNRYTGQLHVDLTEIGIKLSAPAEIPDQSYVCDCTFVYLPQGGMDPYDEQSCAYAFGSYSGDQDGKWLFDGYYANTPSTYVPGGALRYYRCAASYLADCMTRRLDCCPAAPLMSVAMLDTVALYQNEQGFWPTSPVSQWLQTDYGIEAGFYDTRFNTDLIARMLDVNEALGCSLFTDTIRRYYSFYCDFAENNHIETESGGWLVADYWHPEAHQTPHTSLNHQLAEILTLHRAGDYLNSDTLHRLADVMLLAIEDTGMKWVKDNHDLHYCIMPDGSFALADYPCLTYNDMFLLQRYFDETGRAESKTLDRLMGEKMMWMLDLGATDYLR